MSRPLTLVGVLLLLLAFVHCENMIKKIQISDEFNHQSYLIDSKDLKTEELDSFALYPNPDDDGSYIKVYMGDASTYYEAHPTVPGWSPGIFMSEIPRFYLFTSKNQKKGIELFPNTDNKEAKKLFNRNGLVKILCHGFKSSSQKPFPQKVKDEYLTTLKDVNVILIDWADLADHTLYFESAENTNYVGEQTGLLIEKLVKEKFTDFDKIHFIGHSLGAHVGGVAGFTVKGEIARITGLDPAGPGFCEEDKNRRLSPENAKFVDIIHTDIGKYCKKSGWFARFFDALDEALIRGKFGLQMPLGHVDFYPNGGLLQPGCNQETILHKGECSHSRSYDYLKESINSKLGFYSCKCTNWLDYINGDCPGKCKNKILMGEKCPTTSKGEYFLKVSDSYPFAIGEKTF